MPPTRAASRRRNAAASMAWRGRHWPRTRAVRHCVTATARAAAGAIRGQGATDSRPRPPPPPRRRARCSARPAHQAGGRRSRWFGAGSGCWRCPRGSVACRPAHAPTCWLRRVHPGNQRGAQPCRRSMAGVSPPCRRPCCRSSSRLDRRRSHHMPGPAAGPDQFHSGGVLNRFDVKGRARCSST